MFKDFAKACGALVATHLVIFAVMGAEMGVLKLMIDNVR